MKDVREILIEKETDLERLKKEVDSLRMVASLLDENGPGSEAHKGTQAHAVGSEAHSAPETELQAEPGAKPPQSADADQLFSSVEKADTGFWRLGKRPQARVAKPWKRRNRPLLRSCHLFRHQNEAGRA